MADTSMRVLRLLSLLSTRQRWPLGELARRLGVSERTVRRDIDTLRRLDYPVHTTHGPAGGYQLESPHTLPALTFDEDQALAVAVALQTAPNSVFGLAEDAARALHVLQAAMSPRLRAAMEALHVTQLRNHWEFPAPPIDVDTLKAVGSAVRNRHTLVVDELRADGSRPELDDPDFLPSSRVEPHHLVVWASRWYLVVFEPAADRWRVLRVDRLRPQPPTGIPFTPREIPGGDIAHFVMNSHDRGDYPAAWQCTGSACLDLPAAVVARWAPGGSLVEDLGLDRCRLTLGAWSWAGIAGLLSTFDCELTDLRPPELVDACRRLADRMQRTARQHGDLGAGG